MRLRRNRHRRTLSTLLAAALAALSLAACSPQPVGKGGGSSSTAPGDTVRLQGTGATFPMPIYQKWVSEYTKANPKVQIDYQSTGSGAGINQISSGTVDFGASDKFMSDEELKKAQGDIVHVPTVLGAVVLTYNLPGNPELKLSPEVVADIYLGKIKRWDDPRLKADNGGASLPASDITVVSRADGSGTSAVFTDYLSKVSPEWKEKVGAGTSPNWPTGQRAKGNEGVTASVKQNTNTIGYVELVYALQNKLPVATLKNRAGNFVKPSLDAVTAAAAEALPTTPPDLRVSITDAAGATAYPISSYTYVLLYKDQKDAVKGKALVDFLWWALHDGQAVTKDPQYAYAPLPQQVVSRAEAILGSITSGGKTLRS